MINLEFTSDYSSEVVLSASYGETGIQTLTSNPIQIDQSIKYNVCGHYMNYSIPNNSYNFDITDFQIQVSDDISFSSYEVLTQSSLKIIGNVSDFIKDLENITQNYMASVGIVGIGNKYCRFVLTYDYEIISPGTNTTTLLIWIEKIKQTTN